MHVFWGNEKIFLVTVEKARVAQNLCKSIELLNRVRARRSKKRVA